MDDMLYKFITIFLIELIPLFLFIIFALIAWRYKKKLKELKDSEGGQGQNPGLMKSVKRRYIAFSILQWGIFFYSSARQIIGRFNEIITDDLPEMGWKFFLFLEGFKYFSVFIICCIIILTIASLYYGHTPTEMKAKLAAEKERDKEAAEAKARVDE